MPITDHFLTPGNETAPSLRDLAAAAAPIRARAAAAAPIRAQAAAAGQYGFRFGAL